MKNLAKICESKSILKNSTDFLFISFDIFRRLALVVLIFKLILFHPDSNIMFQWQYALWITSQLDLIAFR